MLELRFFGRFELRIDGALILLPSRPAQSLLAYLALSAGTAHRREKLAGLLWPDADEDNARSNLRHALWRIRKAIEPDQVRAPHVLSDELAVSFNAGSNYWLDAAQLASSGDTIQALEESLGVFRGELLPGFYDDWVTLERERLEALFQHKIQRLLDRLVEDQQWPEVLEWAERWVALGHAPEPGYRALMLAHAELGDRSRVASVYQRCRAALFNDLGVEPSVATRRLYERLRRDDAEPITAPQPSTLGAAVVHDEAPAPGQPPFQGLQFFDQSDADRFFGRERLTAQLVGRLYHESFLAVVGASGSGKSSVVRAGLLPALRSARHPAGRDGPGADVLAAEIQVLTPTAHPLDALATSLLAAGFGAERATVVDELGRDPHGLHRFLQLQLQLQLEPGKRTRPARRVVLVVDQFEELFTLCDNSFEREAFAENLLSAAEADGPAQVVIALRADFYAHCAQYARLREAVAQHQEYVGPLSATELRRAIEGPAEQGGWELEPGLVDLLLRDVGEEPGALPLLSHALYETWQRRSGRRLTLAGYSAAGGVQGAIAQTAEAVFTQRLTRAEQTIARRLFLQLTELGEGTQDTRRRAPIAELAGPPDGGREVHAVLAVLAGSRLVTLAERTAEVAHEALIREWPRLREWLSQDREALRLSRQLTRAAQEWERLGRDAGGLFRGARLAQVLDWAGEHREELGRLEEAFLAASRQAAEQEIVEREARRQRELEAARQLADAEQRRADAEAQRADQQRRSAGQLRQRAVLLGLAFTMATIMAGAALFLGDQARQQARTAIARELSAAALSNLSLDPERAAILALQAVDTTYAVDRTWTPDAEDALHRVAPLLRAELRLTGHTGKVLAVAFSPDARRLATASQDGTARVWDGYTGEEQLTLHGHIGSVNSVAFSPDGRLVATASDDRSVRLWDAATGEQRSALTGHIQEVERVAFSPDGARLATASADGTIMLWDPATGTSMLSFRPEARGMAGLHPGSGPNATPSAALPPDVAFGPDGARLATATPFGQVTEWDLSGGQPRALQVWSTVLGDLVPSVAFSPDGTRVAARTDTGVQLWWALTGQPALSIVGHANQVIHTAFGPDGGRLATASLDRTAKVWDVLSGRELFTLAGHGDAVSQVAFSPDGQRLATASWDGSVILWDLGPAREVLTFPTPGTAGWDQDRVDGPQASQVVWTQDGSRVLAGLKDATASVWDSRTGQHVMSLNANVLSGMVGNAPVPAVWSVASSRDGTRFATGGSDRTVRVWDAATGEVVWALSGHTDRVVRVTFSPDGTRLASASLDHTVRVWDLATGQELLALDDPSGPLTSVVFSADGTRIATASEGREHTVRIWDGGSGDLLHILADQQGTVWSVAYNRVGTQLVTAGQDGSARTWDAISGEPLRVLRGHAGSVVSATFSPDGQRIVTGGRDGTARVWDAGTGREVLSLTGTEPREGVDSVAFSPDGRQLAVRGDRALRLYVLGIEDLTALVRGRLTRTRTEEECQRFLHVDQCPVAPAVATAAPRPLATGVPAALPAPAPPSGPLVPQPVVAPPAAGPSSRPLTGVVKIVSSLPRSGPAKGQTDTLVNAFKMALDEHQNRVGDATVVYEDLDDAAANGVWDGPKEAANASRAVNDPDVMVYLGTYNSGAARASIPILCQANLAMISPSNTYPGLTKHILHNAPDEPDVYYPDCKRNYARLAATDDLQGANAAVFARRIGATRAYVLHDSDQYGQILADAFAATATSRGLQVVIGFEATDALGGDYRALAEQVRQSGADVVYWGGFLNDKGGGLWQDLRSTLGTNVALLGGDGVNTPIFLNAAGWAAEGTYATFPGVPASALTGKGADWYQRYKRQYLGEPDPYAAYAYEAMNVALAAIERAANKDRAAIRDAIFATRNYDGILGNWSFTPTGDTTLTMMAMSQVRNGRWDDRSVHVIDQLP